MNKRVAAFPIQEIILNRWSPRAMSGQAVSKQELMPLFEAARWAQSSYNGQPWRFIYGYKGTPAWDRLFKLLVEFNQSWCIGGSVLILVLSRTRFAYNNEPSRTHSFDTGAACENLALEGHARGLVVHGMEGFDYDAARAEFKIPELYAVEAMFVIGKPGDVSVLSPELQKREVLSDRNAINAFAFEGTFPDAHEATSRK